jgi:hypothetical protein
LGSAELCILLQNPANSLLFSFKKSLLTVNSFNSIHAVNSLPAIPMSQANLLLLLREVLDTTIGN